MNEAPQNINLYYNIPPSDKVYKAELIKDSKGWTVNGWNGRRGNTLVQQNKCVGMSFGTALAIYDKLVKSKLAKGYKIESTGPGKIAAGQAVAEYVAPTAKETVSWYFPQLLNVITEDDAISLIIDDDFCLQEKENGKRMGVGKMANGEIQTVNKKTIKVGFPKAILTEAANFSAKSFQIDGEMIGERYKVFDIFELNGKDLRGLSYKERFGMLCKLVGDSKIITTTKTAFTTNEKQLLFKWLRDNNREGGVFKRLSAAHTAGRPASGGDQFKCKFWVMATALISQKNTQRSVQVQMLKGKTLVDVGNVTVKADQNFDAIKVGQLWEVKYLYIIGEGGSLYQPELLFEKDDQDQPDDVKTLKINAKGDEEQ